MKRGILLFAFTNEELDYFKMALCCALSIKSHLKNNHITLVTNKGTLGWGKQSVDEELINEAFDDFIFTEAPSVQNIRTHYDSPWTKFEAPFQNLNRCDAFQITPYEETLLLDVDYLVLNNSFDSVWDNDEDFIINKSASDLKNQPLHQKTKYLSPKGITMRWATCVYFKKTEFSKMVFDLMAFIKENYSFYKHIYQFPGKLYRNDYSISIALHILSGFSENGFIQEFPEKSISTMYQQDDIVEVKDKDTLLFLSHDVDEPWIDTLVKLQNTNVHIMNKRAFLRHSDELIEVFKNSLIQ